jgi:hypothetical protein
MKTQTIALLLCFVSSIAFGHAGGLDSKGGHTDRKTGIYHYHGGGGGGGGSAYSPPPTPPPPVKPPSVSRTPRTSARSSARQDFRSSAKEAESPLLSFEKLEYDVLASKELGKKCYARVKLKNDSTPNESDLKAIPQEVFPEKACWIFVYPSNKTVLQGVVIVAPGKEPEWRVANSKATNVTRDPWLDDGRFAMREWSDASGSYKVMATFEDRSSDKVKLLKADGKSIQIEIEKLSEKDRKWLDAAKYMLP